MAGEKIQEGTDFTALTIRLHEQTLDLCGETYGATKEPPPREQLQALIERAETHMADFRAMLEAYTGGQREAIEAAGNQMGALNRFTAALKEALKAAK